MTESRSIAGYEILGTLGEGGMGIVYRARDAALDRDVALKVIRSAALSAEARARFVREAKACSRITHPNIVTVYAAGEDSGVPWFAMELLEGESLRAVAERGSVPWRAAVGWIAGILDALERLHAEGIVHRDLKPENVIVTRDGAAKLTDFGIARMGGGETLTVDGQTIGTLRYMSPEQAKGSPVDARSDLFSLGAVLYELLAGSPAFTGEHPFAAMYAIMNEEPRPLGEIVPDCPPALAEAIARALAKDPAARFGSAAEFRDALLALAGGTAAVAVAPAAPRSRRPLIAVAAVALAAIAVIAYLLSARREEPAGDRSLAARHDSLARALDGGGDIAAAEIEFQKAIIADPRWEIPVNNLAMLYIRKKDLAGADSLLRIAVERKPDYAAALYNLGDVRLQLGDTAGAETFLRKAIGADSSFVAPYNNLGILLARRGRAVEGAAVLDAGIARERAHPSDRALLGFLLKNRGIAAAKLGRADEAGGYWGEAIEIIPDNAELRRLLAEWREARGEPRAAGR